MQILRNVYETQRFAKEIIRRKGRKQEDTYVRKKAKRKCSLRGRKKDKIRETIHLYKTFRALDVANNI